MIILWLVDVAGNLFGSPVSDFVTYLSMSGHYYDFLRGVINTRDVVYYLSVTAAFLFLSVQALQLRRWR
jgi:ABC-2 type transport system permease protein